MEERSSLLSQNGMDEEKKVLEDLPLVEGTQVWRWTQRQILQNILEL